MLDEGLGDTGVDVVVAHLVAHTEGAPAQGQLGQVPRTQHDPAALARDTEEEVSAQARLDVLKGDVIDLPAPLAAAVGVTHLSEHLGGGGTDVQLLDVAAQSPGQGQGIGLGVLGGGEARHGDGVDVLAPQTQAVHRPGGDDEGVGGVQPAGHADDDRGQADGLHTLDQGRDLDVVGLVAVLGQAGRVVRDKGEAVHGAAQPDVGARGAQSGDRDTPEGGVSEQRGAVVIEGALAQALGCQGLDVDVDHRGARAVREALGGAQQLPTLVDEGLPVPGQVRGGLPLAGGGVDVGSQVPGGGGAGQQLAVLGPANRDGRARDVDQDAGAGQRGQRGGGHWDPHVLTDLDVEGQARHVWDLEEQVRTEGHAGTATCRLLRGTGRGRLRGGGGGGGVPHAGQREVLDADLGPTGEVPALVELAVGGQVGLRRDAQDPAALDDDGTVVQPCAHAQRGADDERRQKLGAGSTDLLDSLKDGGGQDVGQEEVVH